MPDLTITRALPNPAGKDRTPANRVTNEQLNGEWLEFGNTSGKRLDINGVTLNHYTFDAQCQRTGEDVVLTFKNALEAGHSIRVHTGSGQVYSEGTLWHLYAGRGNFIWNNACGDTAVIRAAGGGLIDWASYDPRPAEGAVLERLPGTNKLSGLRSTRRPSG